MPRKGTEPITRAQTASFAGLNAAAPVAGRWRASKGPGGPKYAIKPKMSASRITGAAKSNMRLAGSSCTWLPAAASQVDPMTT